MSFSPNPSQAVDTVIDTRVEAGERTDATTLCTVESLAKVLLGGALVLALLGGALFLAARLGVERLPGDIVVGRGNFTLYAPIGLMILLSIVLTIALNLFLRR